MWTSSDPPSGGCEPPSVVHGPSRPFQSIESQELALREAAFRALVENVSEAIAVFDLDGTVLYANRVMEDLAGPCVGERLDGVARERVHPEDQVALRDAWLAAAAADGLRERTEVRMHAAGRHWAVLEVSIGNRVAEPAIRGMVVTVRDVTEQRQAEQRAQWASRQWQQLSGDAISISDVQGRVLFWNQGSERMFGWTADEMLGRPTRTIPPDRRAERRRHWLAVTRNRTHVSYETERLTKDGRRIPCLVTHSALLGEDGVGGVLTIAKDMSAHRELEEKSKALALMQERERIAMDLHDGIIQSLYAIGLSLGALSLPQSRQQPAAGTLREAARSIDETIDHIRRYISELRSPDDGLQRDAAVAIQAVVEDVQARSPIAIETDYRFSLPLKLPSATVSHLVSIVHEALSNSLRHAEASALFVSLAAERRMVRLVLGDNGKGFSARRSGRRAGDGIGNMRARAKAIQAKLEIVSRPGAGTRVCLALPLEET